VFPATVWSPDGLANVFRAMPFLHLIPTGGVGADNAAAWLGAGATALGIGSSLSASVDSVAELHRAIAAFRTAGES
jgi:2-dehydro-3-deoxyphosphogluconate aldolase/(4S)-4-hydroxy-2-oxoglutarate aldolase